jgi:hypothetical protein
MMPLRLITIPTKQVPLQLTVTNANLVPDLAAATDIVSNPKPTTVANPLLPLPSDGTKPAAALQKLPSYGTQHVVDTHPLLTLGPGEAWHKLLWTSRPTPLELTWHLPPMQKMKSKKMMMDDSM